MLAVKDIQRILCVGRDTAYALMHSSSFPSIKIGKRYYVSEEALAEWLKRYEGKVYKL